MINQFFSRFATWSSVQTGRAYTFSAAIALVVIWLITGPLFDFSDAWQLVINTSTTIITFFMVFILQNSHNRDVSALHAKLDELILTSQRASNQLLNLEELSEDEIENIRSYYREIREKRENRQNLIEE